MIWFPIGISAWLAAVEFSLTSTRASNNWWQSKLISERQWHISIHKWHYNLLWHNISIPICCSRTTFTWPNNTSIIMPLKNAIIVSTNALQIEPWANLEPYRTNEAKTVATHHAVKLVKTAEHHPKFYPSEQDPLYHNPCWHTHLSHACSCDHSYSMPRLKWPWWFPCPTDIWKWKVAMVRDEPDVRFIGQVNRKFLINLKCSFMYDWW
jgi:hypothetical protein